jgi:hypothetical protein
MCSVSIVSSYYLSSSLSSGLGTHCSFLSRIHPLSMPWERSCDGFWSKVGLCMCSVSIVSFYYLHLFLIRLRYSRQLFSAFDSVSAFSIIVSVSFSVYRSRIYYSTAFSFLSPSSSSPTSVRSRHPNNMSPIMTFLVSGLLSLFRRCVAFILGFLAMSPVPFMASCFPAGVASPWVRRPPQNFSSFKALRRHRLSSLGLKTPAKLHFPSWLLPHLLGLKTPAQLHFSTPRFRLGQSRCISPPIVHRPFEFLFRLVRRYSRYLFFVVSSSRILRFLVSFSSLSRPYSSLLVAFLVVFLRTYPTPSVCFSAILDVLCLPSVSSFVFGSHTFSIPLIFLGIGLRLQSPRLVDTSPVLDRFLVILIMPFVFCSFVLLDTSFPFLRTRFRLSPVSRPCVVCFRVLWFNPHRLSLSSISAFVSSRQSIITAQPVIVYPSSFLRITRPLPSFRSSFHLVLLLRPFVHDSITLRSWPSWVCRVSYAHGGSDVYSTLASIFYSGCATYPMLVVGVTCTLSSRSFYSVRLVTSWPSSMFRSPSLSCFCNSSSPVTFLSIGYRLRLRLRQYLHGFAIVFLLFHHRIPVVIR